MIGQISIRSRWHWSNFLWQQMELYRIPSRVKGISLPFCMSQLNWSDFLEDLVKLSRIPSGVLSGGADSIGQTSFRSRWNQSTCLQEKATFIRRGQEQLWECCSVIFPVVTLIISILREITRFICGIFVLQHRHIQIII